MNITLSAPMTTGLVTGSNGLLYRVLDGLVTVPLACVAALATAGYVPLPPSDASGPPSLPSQEAQGRTLTDADVGRVLNYTGADAADFVLPSELSPGFTCAIKQAADAGRARVIGADGVQVDNVEGQYRTRGPKAVIGIMNSAPNVYDVTGATGA